MTNNVTIAKGSLSVTIATEEVSENYANKITFIRPPTTKQVQSSGPTEPKAIDLLIITHELLIRGRISGTVTKTAKEVKEDLVDIFKGASTDGGASVVTYAGDAFNMFPGKLLCVEKAIDEEGTIAKDVAKYDVQLTCIEGASI